MAMPNSAPDLALASAMSEAVGIFQRHHQFLQPASDGGRLGQRLFDRTGILEAGGGEQGNAAIVRLDHALGAQALDGGKWRRRRRLWPDAFLGRELDHPSTHLLVVDSDGGAPAAAQ